MIIKPIRCSIFLPRQSLETYVVEHLSRLREGDILVVTSKIVALAEGRVVRNGRGRKARLIKGESECAIKTRWCYLALKDGHWCPNAGIDESNADGNLILWPSDSYAAAAAVRTFLRKKFHLRNLGVLITDSRTYPLRSGVTGVALGYAGFNGLRDYRGKTDIFGRRLEMTQTNVADTLASAAVLVMGEGSERTPLAIVRNAPVRFAEKVDRTELLIDPANDMYRPLFEWLQR